MECKSIRGPSIYLTFTAAKELLNIIALVSALLGSIFASLLFSLSYEDAQAITERLQNDVEGWENQRWDMVIAQLGAWTSVLFVCCVMGSVILTIDMTVFVDDGGPEEDDELQMKVWLGFNRYPVMALIVMCLFGCLLGTMFLYYMGWVFLPDCNRPYWRNTGLTFMVGLIVTVCYYSYNLYTGRYDKTLSTYREHKSASNVAIAQNADEMQSLDPTDLPALFGALGLDGFYGEIAMEIKLADLKSLAQDDSGACLNELKEAGVSAGHRIKIVRALRHGLPQQQAINHTPNPMNDG